MYNGKILFAQVMDFLPWKTFHRIVSRYGGDQRVRTLSCSEQFRVMAFAQLTYRESLRDIEACLLAQAAKLYHMGIHQPAPRLTLADANVNVLDLLVPEPGAFYVMDRGYLDFERLCTLHRAGSFFVTRAKSNMNAHRVYSAQTDRTSGVICDQTIALNGHYTQRHYPDHLRRTRFKNAETNKTLVFLTNQTLLPDFITDFVGDYFRENDYSASTLGQRLQSRQDNALQTIESVHFLTGQ